MLAFLTLLHPTIYNSIHRLLSLCRQPPCSQPAYHRTVACMILGHPIYEITAVPGLPGHLEVYDPRSETNGY